MNEQSKPLVSIVVPIYKVAPLLDRCVSSLVSQTYENIEVFLVDDGSPDESPAKCDAWAAKDQRVNVIHKKNEGVSVARNTGLDAAHGEYVWFVDGDDYVAPNAVEELVKRAECTSADIVFCSNYDSVFADDVYTDVRHNRLLDFDAKTNAEFNSILTIEICTLIILIIEFFLWYYEIIVVYGVVKYDESIKEFVERKLKFIQSQNEKVVNIKLSSQIHDNITNSRDTPAKHLDEDSISNNRIELSGDKIGQKEIDDSKMKERKNSNAS